MLGIIAKFIFGGSLIGMGVIALRRAPDLAKISEEEIEKIDLKRPFALLVKRVKRSRLLSSNFLLQKILSKVRILTLVIERKTESKLKNLRETEKRKKEIENDSYWEKLKEAKKKDD